MKVNSVVNADGTVAAAGTDNQTESASDTSFSNYMDQSSLRYGDYLEQIFQKASDTYNVSKDLLKAMAKAESNFKAKETSHAGAMGIMQLMPATAASLGVTDAYDPEQNIMGGAKYISQLLSRYNGNLSYAIAAYNAGSGNVDKYGGIPPFSETQTYVARVLQYMQEGVTIPDSSGTAGTSSAGRTSSTASGTSAGGSSTGALENMMNKYFDYEDYLEFLQLFTRIIYEKLTGEKAETAEKAETKAETEEEPSAAGEEVQQQTEQAQPAKYLTMKVKDAYGHVSTYRQNDSDSEAYTAYRNMTAGSQNRMSIFLKQTSKEM